MKKFSVLLIVLFGFMSFMASCAEDDKKVEEIVEKKWEEDTRFFRNSKILLNSGISDDKLIVVGINTYSVFENNYEYEPHNYVSSTYYSFDYKPVIHTRKQIIAHALTSKMKNSDFMFDFPLMNENDSWPNFLDFDLNKLDEYSENAYITHINDYRYEFGAFNNQDQFLVIVNDNYISDSNEKIYTNSFALMDLNIDENTTVYLSNDPKDYLIMNPEIKNIEFPSVDEGVRIPNLIYSFNEYFFVKFNSDNLWRISPNGELIEISDNFDSKSIMFDFDNILYYSSYKSIYKSLDNGLTWELVGDIFPSIERGTFFKVNGSLYWYIYSQIFSVEIGTNGFTITELDNSGLEGYEITSITEFQDRVYVTTLSGLFYKSIEDFLEPKKIETEE
jgi:hypothetical protein